MNASSKNNQTELDATVEAASNPTPQEQDVHLRGLSRELALQLSVPMRLRWFYLQQIKHRNLLTVYTSLSELLEPTNDVNIISLVGMTGVGKTTLATQLVPHLCKQFGDVPDHEIPVIYVKVPADGDRKTSWIALYRRIQRAANEILLKNRIAVDLSTPGEMRYSARASRSHSGLREVLEPLIINRNIRVLILDEAVHLLRFHNYDEIMDTIKSLSDVGNLKLLLIGSYNITELVTSYGQVTRRGEVVHYKRYALGSTAINGEPVTDDQKDFQKALGLMQEVWPSTNVPNLIALWHEWMRQSLGSVGLLKLMLLRLAALQLKAPSEILRPDMLKKVFKAPRALEKMEKEATMGEHELKGLCYGDCEFNDDELAAFHKLLNT